MGGVDERGEVSKAQESGPGENGQRRSRSETRSDDLLLEKGLPSNVEAERSILGAILLDNMVCNQAIELMRREDFFLDSHRRIFGKMVSLTERGIPVDLISLGDELRRAAEFEQIGGATYIASLIDGVPRTDSVEHYCRIVKYKSRERQALAELYKGATQIIDGEQQLDATLEYVQSRLKKISESGSGVEMLRGVYPTLDAFFDAQIQDPEPILFGVHRGEVAALLAMTNYGKTTALLNTALSVAAGQLCLPLVPVVARPLRVLYIDSESPASRARADLQTMIANISNSKLARQNFLIVVDAFINSEPLNLSRPDHFKRIVALAMKHRADLVIVDTAASAFELQDENSNAEVTRRLMNPLKRLAREVDCAVVFTHHIGKANETQTGEAAYRGRGASAFGALSRTVFTIEKDPKKGPEYIVLSCAKIKGQPFQPALLKLDPDKRWFEICDERPEAKPEPPTAQEIADFVASRKEARTDEIKRHFSGRASARTIAGRIAEADRLRLIEKPTQKAPWRLCNGKNGDSLTCEQVQVESTESAFVQNANPIRDCINAQMDLNGSPGAGFTYCPNCGSAGLPHSYCDRCGEFLRDSR